jgi:hypothetical protein
MSENVLEARFSSGKEIIVGAAIDVICREKDCYRMKTETCTMTIDVTSELPGPLQ